ncbi:MAG: LicD family protein [Eggerthellaceae bacterium]|jgi:phosphorylcholine metabolism protein LicD
MQPLKSFDYAPNAHKAKDWQRAVTAHLAVLDRICRENGISYSLCFGGLLGAIRHRGFIPWDNDVDVVMFEQDYLKLQGLALERKLPEGYELIDRKTEKDYPLLFGRFIDSRTSCPLSTSSFNGGAHGVFVDVFVLFPLNEDEVEQQAQITDFLVWEELQCWVKRRAGYRTPAFAQRWREIKQYEAEHGRKAALDEIERTFRSRMPEQSTWCFHGSGGSYNGFPRFKTEWFADTVPVPFENLELQAPVGALELLQQFYGAGWRLFPTGEKFKPYAASSLTIPGSVMTRDYMQFIDQDEAISTLRECKDALMEELLVRCDASPALLAAEAELAALDFNKSYAPLVHEAEKLIAPENIASSNAGETFARFDELATDTIAIHRRPHFKTGHVAPPIESALLSAGLWTAFLRRRDFWNVEKAISLQQDDPEHCRFSDTETNRNLMQVLKAADALYLSMDRRDVSTAEESARTLTELCPCGLQTAVAWAFIATQRAKEPASEDADIDSAVETVRKYRSVFPDEDYLKLFDAELATLQNRRDEASAIFADLARSCDNGMIVQECDDFCKAKGLSFPMRKLPDPTSSDERSENRFSVDVMLSAKDFTHAGLKGLKVGRKLAASHAMDRTKGLHDIERRVDRLQAKVSRYRDFRRLTDRRVDAWERVYPRKQALLKAAKEGNLDDVRAYAKPYLNAVYKLIDREKLGVFIDKEIYEACKPVFVADRGKDFLDQYEKAVPEGHKVDIATMLQESGVDHPYLR